MASHTLGHQRRMVEPSKLKINALVFIEISLLNVYKKISKTRSYLNFHPLLFSLIVKLVCFFLSAIRPLLVNNLQLLVYIKLPHTLTTYQVNTQDTRQQTRVPKYTLRLSLPTEHIQTHPKRFNPITEASHIIIHTKLLLYTLVYKLHINNLHLHTKVHNSQSDCLNVILLQLFKLATYRQITLSHRLLLHKQLLRSKQLLILRYKMHINNVPHGLNVTYYQCI